VLDQLVDRIQRAGLLSFKVHPRIRDGKEVDAHAFVGDRQLRYGVDARIASNELNKLCTQGVLLPGCTIYRHTTPEKILCHRCHRPGHLMSSCPSELSCRICGIAGHADKNCPNKLDVEMIACRVCIDRGPTMKYQHSTLNCPRIQHYEPLSIIKNNTRSIKPNKTTHVVAMSTSANKTRVVDMSTSATSSHPHPSTTSSTPQSKSSVEGQLRQPSNRSYAAAVQVGTGRRNSINQSCNTTTSNNNTSIDNNQQQQHKHQQQHQQQQQPQQLLDITHQLKQLTTRVEKIESNASLVQHEMKQTQDEMKRNQDDFFATCESKMEKSIDAIVAKLEFKLVKNINAAIAKAMAASKRPARDEESKGHVHDDTANQDDNDDDNDDDDDKAGGANGDDDDDDDSTAVVIPTKEVASHAKPTGKSLIPTARGERHKKREVAKAAAVFTSPGSNRLTTNQGSKNKSKGSVVRK
jgi:hypothetical protein